MSKIKNFHSAHAHDPGTVSSTTWHFSWTFFLNIYFFAFPKGSIICCDCQIILLSIGFHRMITQKVVLGCHGGCVGRVRGLVDAVWIFG